MTTYTFKRGNTFELSGVVAVVQDSVAVLDLTGWEGSVYIRDANAKLISKPTFSWLDATTRLVKVRETATNTALWPVGSLYMDIRFVAPNGDIVNTSTATIEVVKEITNA
jgi:hypothetical protein